MSPGGVRTTQRRQLLQRSVLLAGAQAATWALTLTWMVQVPRTLGPSGLGRYAAAMGLLTVAMALGTMGLDVHLVRAVARRDSRTEVASGWLLGLGLVALCSMAGFTVAQLLLDPLPALWLSAGFGAQAVGNLAFTPLQGSERPAARALSDIVAKSVFVVGSLVALGTASTLTGICLAYFAGYALYAVLGYLLGMRRHGVRLRQADRATMRRVLAKSRSMGVHLLGQAIYYRADSVMLAPMRSPWAAGQYGAAYRLFDTLSFVTTLYGVVAAPRVLRLARDAPEQAAREVRGGVLLMGGLAVAAFAGVLVFAGPVVHLVYGPAFEGAVVPLQILGLALALSFLATPYAWALVAVDRQSAMARLSLQVAGFNLVCNAVAIPLFGAPGAAVTTVLSEVALLAGSRRALAGHAISPVFRHAPEPQRLHHDFALCSVR